MPEPVIVTSVPGNGPAPANGPADRSGVGQRSARRAAPAVFLAAMIAVYLWVAGPMMASAVGHLASASSVWLIAALMATTASMVAFAVLRSQTLAAAGSPISLRRAVAVSYGAGAVHTTLPAGAVFSTSYAFRHLRAWGASSSATTWSMTITGLLSTLTLGIVGLLGLVLGAGTGGSLLWPVTEVIGAVAVIGALVHLGRHPGVLVRVAHRIMGSANRLRRRPAEFGFARLADGFADLRSIRPSGRDWSSFLVLAFANWALDLGCLAACCAAVGLQVSFPALLITYAAGMAAGSLLPLPAGLGAVETAMTLGLTVAGAAASPALAAVLLYRLLSTGSVLVIGWLVVATQRIRPAVAPTPIPTPALRIAPTRNHHIDVANPTQIGEKHDRSQISQQGLRQQNRCRPAEFHCPARRGHRIFGPQRGRKVHHHANDPGP